MWSEELSWSSFADGSKDVRRRRSRVGLLCAGFSDAFKRVMILPIVAQPSAELNGEEQCVLEIPIPQI